MFLRLMWSSAMSGPASGVSSAPHWLSGAPSWWVTKRNAEERWFDHITPIWPLNAITAEMSSGSTAVSSTGGLYAVLHFVSVAVECMTQTLLDWVKLVHSMPVVSRAMVAVSKPPP